tara:strand:+ start:161 stop:1297 length:1137 start_codon:yes stop_codon:yes gene_type:complete
MKYLLIFFISILLSKISIAKDIKETKNFKKNFFFVELIEGHLFADFNSNNVKDKIHYVNIVLNYRNPDYIAKLSKKYDLKNKGFEGKTLSEFTIMKINCETYEMKNFKNVFYDKHQEGKMLSMKGNILLSLDNIEEEWFKLPSDNYFRILPDKYCKSYQSKKLNSLVSEENNQIKINNKEQLFEYLAENKLYLKTIETFDDFIDKEWKKVTEQEFKLFHFKKLTNPANTKFKATITSDGVENTYYWQTKGKNFFSLNHINSKRSPSIYEIDFKNNIVQYVCERGAICRRYKIIVSEEEKIVAEKEFEKASIEARKKREQINYQSKNNNSNYEGFAIIYYTTLGIDKNGVWGIECQYKNKPSIKLKAPSPSGPLPICPK